MDGLITFAAQYLMIFSIFACIYLYFSLEEKKRKSFVLTLLLGGVITLLLAQLGSMLYDNPRPFISDGSKALFSASLDNGFPSDHALLAALLAFAALAYSRRLGLVLLGVAVVIGWARVAGGVHHAVDVLGSLFFAGVAVLIVKTIIDQRSKQAKLKTPAET